MIMRMIHEMKMRNDKMMGEMMVKMMREKWIWWMVI